MSIDNLIKDYYKLKISLSEICQKENTNQSTFYRYLKSKGLKPRREYYGMIQLGDEELNSRMKDKYAGIVKRCTGKPSYKYKESYEGKDYMTIYEWVEFCNNHKELLLRMWREYIESGKKLDKAISVDRIDNNRGYTSNNVEFVTYGYNSWKRNLKPIKVMHNSNTKYFMSCEEASNWYGVRRQSIGDLLRGVKREIGKYYDVQGVSVNEALRMNNKKSLKDYYDAFIKESGLHDLQRRRRVENL